MTSERTMRVWFRAYTSLTGAVAVAALVVTSCRGISGYPALPDVFDPDSVPDAFRHPCGALMQPGAHRAFMVTERGDLTNGAWVVHTRLQADNRDADPPRRIAAEERWLPVLHWR